MAVINAGSRFASKREKSIPMYKLPKNVRQSLNIDTMSASGMGKLTPGKKNCLYDRCYIFEEINYINKDISGKERFLNQLMGWLKTMNVDFKIVITNEYQSIDEFLGKVRSNKNRDSYREVDQGMDEWIHEKLADSNPNVTTLRYLVVSCRANTISEANIVLNALDTTISDMFRVWHSRIIRLDGAERMKCLHSLLRVGKKEEEEYISFPDTTARDWRNDILPGTIKQHFNFLELDQVYVSVLYGSRFRKSLESDTFIRSFSNLEFPSFVTMDFAPVPADIIEDKLVAVSMNNERAISDEEEKKRRNNTASNGPSYPRQRKKEEIEGYMDQLDENDEMGFFMNFLVVVTAEDEMALAERVGQVQAIGTKEGVVMDTANYQQLKALMTALPFGGRQVDYMRFFLSSSIVAFQPYYAQDIIEPGGFMYGLNRTTKRLIIGNRKLLMNPHGIIIGHTGSGKSVIIKVTEILQTLLATDDDILILDPQNEFADIVRNNGGAYFDLTPKSGINLNGFEVSEEVFYAEHEVKEKFIATQVKYAASLLAAVMSNIVFTQEHSSVVGRCTRRMFEQYFAGKNFRITKQPTLKLLRMEIGKELEAVKNEHDEKIIRPIYNSLEEYTEGACDMLAHPSTVKMDNRLIGFGLKDVPEGNWEAVMITIMHYTSARMEYNQMARRATHFIVDETQVVSKKGTSADQLNTAVATFRKFGGICTMAMQNLTAALENDQLKELFSNCSYKCFLDQGGVDANALAEIQELSETEFHALASDEVGQGVMVWGKKVVLFDAKISKENTIYPALSTNFHEKAEKLKSIAPGSRKTDVDVQKDRKESNFQISDRGEEIILSMAEITSITAKDVLTVLDISLEEAQEQLEYLCGKGILERVNENGRVRYQKGV